MMDFLGEPIEFWVNIRKELVKNGTIELHKENIKLRGKINLYESRIKELAIIVELDN